MTAIMLIAVYQQLLRLRSALLHCCAFVNVLLTPPTTAQYITGSIHVQQSTARDVNSRHLH